ncbi:unnamed protein product, partial [Ostreobium quekettii]
MWCAPDGGGPDRWRLAPCVLQTLGACLLLPLSSWGLHHQARRLCGTAFDRPRSPRRRPGRPDPALLLCAGLATMHAGWLVALCVPRPHLEPYQWFYQLAMSATWLGACGSIAGARIAGVPARMGGLGATAAAAYLAIVAGWMAREWGQWGRLAWEDWMALGLAVAGATASAGVVAAGRKRSLADDERWLLDAADEETAVKKKRNWFELFITAAVYVWPKDWLLKARAFICIVLLLIIRALRLVVPITLKHLVDRLVEITAKREQEHVTYWEAFYPWGMAFLIGLSVAGMPGIGMQGGAISTARQTLFFPITQFAYRRISVDLFKHILEMDLTYHLHRKTGEVMRVMDRGTTAMQTILSTIIFNIGPQLVDMLIGTVYLASEVEPFIGVVIIVTLASYLPVTIVLTEFRRKLRKLMNLKDNEMGFKATDAFLNYETVKYFNNDDYEVRNYAQAVEDYQKVELKMFLALQLMNVLQTLIMVA